MSNTMTPLEHLRRVSRKAPLNEWMGLEVVSASEGAVELRLAWKPEFAQYNGFLHASLVGGLIDTACGFAALTMAGPVLVSQFSTRMLRPAKAEVFIASARVDKPGRKQVFTSASVYAEGAPDKPFALGDAICVPVE